MKPFLVTSPTVSGLFHVAGAPAIHFRQMGNDCVVQLASPLAGIG
jgi:hypothetical protein